MRAVLVFAAIGFVMSALGCTPAPRGLSWTIDFDTPALSAQTSVVQARILRGTCTGTLVYQTELRPSGTMMGGTMTMTPPALGPGAYAFVATAYDATCTAIGDDCQSVTLPGAASVANLIRAHAGVAACPAATCHSGSCAVDSGVLDAGPSDAPPIDSPTDAVVCTTTETNCTNHLDDDCDGHTDCADSDCTSNAACAMCVGVTCGVCQMCDPTNGSCMAATDGSTCTGGRCVGGACCTGCVSAGMCVTGNSPAACGNGGQGCSACGECNDCTAGACTPGMAGASCLGGAGHCVSGACCTGCIDGTSSMCTSGTVATACGNGGTSCASCSECQTCNGVGCLNVGDGMACGGGGACLNGACCNGCFSVGTCQPGNTAGACGPRGGSCVTCGECQSCSASGTCVPAADGTMCTNGTCVSGACCTGCIQGGACQSGTSDGACGFGGNPCGSCPASMNCSGNVCTGPGDDCTNFIDLTGLPDSYIPIDTCMYANTVDIMGCGTPGTPDVVFSCLEASLGCHVDGGSGWVVGELFSTGTCMSIPGSCSTQYGASGSDGNVRWWFALERDTGGCGRVNVHVQP